MHIQKVILVRVIACDVVEAIQQEGEETADSDLDLIRRYLSTHRDAANPLWD